VQKKEGQKHVEKRYHLSITLLLNSTRGVHQELSFQTRLPPERISKEECVVQLRVLDGTILSCEIKSATGGPILFQQEQAIESLKSLGMLEWHRAPSLAYQAEGISEQRPMFWQSSPPLRSIAEQASVPRRLNADLPRLDPLPRRVFLLVDGTRNVHHIAKLLGKSPEEILIIIQALQEQNFIAF
jgi:hypothetical protein